MEQLVEYTNNNLLLVAGTVMMALAVIFYELRMQAGSVAAMSSNGVVSLINQGAKVVDIRDAAIFDAGHIVDAVNIPGPDLVGEQSKKLKKAKSIVLVCDTGAKSGQSATSMRKEGFENTFSLQGGMAAWRRDNLPIVAAETSGKRGAGKAANDDDTDNQ
jgi:rhodanese-related sulfurtransferase